MYLESHIVPFDHIFCTFYVSPYPYLGNSLYQFQMSLYHPSLMVFQNLENRNVGAGQKSNHTERNQRPVLP